MSFWDGSAWVHDDPHRLPPRPPAGRLADWGSTLLIAVMLAVLVLPWSLVSAAGPTLTVTPSSGQVGTSIALAAASLTPRTRYQVLIDDAFKGLPAVMANRKGRLATEFILPSLAAGQHVVSLRPFVVRVKVATSMSQLGAVVATASLGLAVPSPTPVPTPRPSPSAVPTATPTPAPTAAPTSAPTATPTAMPTATAAPTLQPSPSSASTTYYVAPGGSDTNSGGTSDPWRTPAKAVATAVAGSTILLRTGMYPPFSVARQGLTIAAYPGDTPTISGGTTGIAVTASDTTIRGLRVTGASGQGIWVDGASRVTLSTLRVDGNIGHGIQVIRSSVVLVSDSTISANGKSGLRELDGTSDSRYLRNTVTDNGHDGEPYNGDGILIQGSGALVGSNVVLRNGDSATFEHGIYIASVASGYTVENNTVRDNAASGIKASGAGSITGNAVSGSVRGIVFADDGGTVSVEGNTITATTYAILVTSNCRIARFTSDRNTFDLERFGLAGTVLDLPGWRGATGLDLHSN